MHETLRSQVELLLREGLEGSIAGGLKGLEKESLRVTPDGEIAQTDHPRALGSALTHPHITTDYSEALLEFVTGTSTDLDVVYGELENIHRYVYPCLDDELLWSTSMPCVVKGDESIPIARYGTSNSGTMRNVYRRGLAHRYGKTMQVIAGTHYNYSLPEAFWPAWKALQRVDGPMQRFVSDRYFGLVRNVLRNGWLLLYLFGASPAVCNSFLRDDPDRFEPYNENTRYSPFATSLRMSDVGYTNRNPNGLDVRYDDIDTYIAGLTQAIETPFSEYEALGIERDGEYIQLNTNILQIENEYYSPVRPKQPPERGEKPTDALKRRGVRYVELRSLDLDPFSPVGVNPTQLRFLEAFCLMCFLSESGPLSIGEHRAVEHNFSGTAVHGRDDAFRLQRGDRQISARDWASELLEEMVPIAEFLDSGGGDQYRAALSQIRNAAAEPEALPSAHVLHEMRSNDIGFYHFAMKVSREHQESVLARPLSASEHNAYRTMASQSLEAQAELEAGDDVSFKQYLRRYFAGG